jgi:RNA polymerase sigma factor (sigma-70 family)
MAHCSFKTMSSGLPEDKNSPLAPLTRHSLLLRLRDGNLATRDQDWDDFYNQYNNPMSIWATGLVGADAASDLVQETWFVLLKMFHEGKFPYEQGKGKFHSWLWGVLRMKGLEAFRKSKKARNTSLDEEDPVTGRSLKDDLPGEGAHPLEKIDEEWRRSLNEEALRLLRKEAKAKDMAIYEALIGGKDPVLVAEEFGISRGYVDVIKHRVGKRHKKIVQSLEEGELVEPDQLKDE